MAGQLDVRQFIGKRVYAKKPTPIYRAAFDNQVAVFTVDPGSEIGVCFSWLDPRSGRSKQWLMFEDVNKRPYYCPLDDKIDLNKMVDQGVKDDKTVAKEKADSNKSEIQKFFDGLSATGKTILNLGGLLVLAYGIKEASAADKRRKG